MRRLAALLALLLAAVPGTAAGQAYADPQPTVQVSALVTAPLTATALNPLQFGLVLPGDSVSVAPLVGTTLHPEAGIWQVRTRPNHKNLYVAFVLPAELTHTTRAGVTLPVSFDGNYLAVCEMTNAGCVNGRVINPSTYPYPTGYQMNLVAGGGQNKDVRLHLGGMVRVPADQMAGDYLGTATLRFYSTN